jgi:hypothetical protein
VFWTNRIPTWSVKTEAHDPASGASLEVNELDVFDYFSINNSLSDGNSIPAHASYRMRWAGDGTPLTVDDGANFHVDGIQTTATIAWSAREDGFSFQSDPPDTTQTNFALFGVERNGVFYSGS